MRINLLAVLCRKPIEGYPTGGLEPSDREGEVTLR
jgi:hypothetical protein